MPVPAPGWRIKRRPCPFYKRGKCIFADSCNFVHDAIDKPTPTTASRSQCVSSLIDVLDENGTTRPPDHPTSTPSTQTAASISAVASESARSVSSSKPIREVVSFPRTESPPDVACGSNTETHISSTSLSGPTSDVPEVTPLKDPTEIAHDTLADSFVKESASVPVDPDAASAVVEIPPRGTTPDLLSPVSMSHLTSFDLQPKHDNSFDSGYGEGWSTPQPLRSPLRPLQTSPHALQSPTLSQSPSVSFSPIAHYHVMTPTAITSLGLHASPSSRIFSPPRAFPSPGGHVFSSPGGIFPLFPRPGMSSPPAGSDADTMSLLTVMPSPGRDIPEPEPDLSLDSPSDVLGPSLEDLVLPTDGHALTSADDATAGEESYLAYLGSPSPVQASLAVPHPDLDVEDDTRVEGAPVDTEDTGVWDAVLEAAVGEVAETQVAGVLIAPSEQAADGDTGEWDAEDVVAMAAMDTRIRDATIEDTMVMDFALERDHISLQPGLVEVEDDTDVQAPVDCGGTSVDLRNNDSENRDMQGVTENDTIHNLYEVYSEIGSDDETASLAADVGTHSDSTRPHLELQEVDLTAVVGSGGDASDVHDTANAARINERHHDNVSMDNFRAIARPGISHASPAASPRMGVMHTATAGSSQSMGAVSSTQSTLVNETRVSQDSTSISDIDVTELVLNSAPPVPVSMSRQRATSIVVPPASRSPSRKSTVPISAPAYREEILSSSSRRVFTPPLAGQSHASASVHSVPTPVAHRVFTPPPCPVFTPPPRTVSTPPPRSVSTAPRSTVSSPQSRMSMSSRSEHPRSRLSTVSSNRSSLMWSQLPPSSPAPHSPLPSVPGSPSDQPAVPVPPKSAPAFAESRKVPFGWRQSRARRPTAASFSSAPASHSPSISSFSHSPSSFSLSYVQPASAGAMYSVESFSPSDARPRRFSKAPITSSAPLRPISSFSPNMLSRPVSTVLTELDQPPSPRLLQLAPQESNGSKDAIYDHTSPSLAMSPQRKLSKASAKAAGLKPLRLTSLVNHDSPDLAFTSVSSKRHSSLGSATSTQFADELRSLGDSSSRMDPREWARSAPASRVDMFDSPAHFHPPQANNLSIASSHSSPAHVSALNIPAHVLESSRSHSFDALYENRLASHSISPSLSDPHLRSDSRSSDSYGPHRNDDPTLTNIRCLSPTTYDRPTTQEQIVPAGEDEKTIHQNHVAVLSNRDNFSAPGAEDYTLRDRENFAMKRRLSGSRARTSSSSVRMQPLPSPCSTHASPSPSSSHTGLRSLLGSSRQLPSLANLRALATPRPTLMFAIAGDDPAEVRRVLMEVDSVAVNNTVGPQSALAFALTSNQLVHKLEIVKTLLAYGADPGSLKSSESNPPSRRASLCPNADDVGTAPSCHAPDGFMSALDPATRYYVERAEAPETCRVSKLLHRTEFQPLARGLHAEIVGQTRALEQLAKILSIHFPRSVQHGKPSSMYSQKAPRNAMVVLLCGPSGHGKSLLARKFGSLLDVPTHTVNMTTLGSANDLWQSYSLSPYEEPSPYTLAEFLSEHEGERCVVVLDEIEKTLNETALWSLLMPWELGRCTFHAGSRNIDVRNVIWIGTSNIGHTLVYGDPDPDDTMPREDYVTLMNGMRPRVSERLGASVVSRVSAILPFVPFTRQEKQAIAAESLLTLVADHAGDPDVDTDRLLKKATMDKIIDAALADYEPAEGARSLYRNVSNLLVDML